MSLVGPRPEMLENVEKYTREVPEFRYRQRMKAGLTGLAQIEGKYNTSPKDQGHSGSALYRKLHPELRFQAAPAHLYHFLPPGQHRGLWGKALRLPLMRTEARSGREETEIPASSEQGRSDQDSFLRKAL